MTPPQYQCSRCNMGFESQDDLDKHNSRVHPMSHVPDDETPSRETEDRTKDKAARPDSATPERGGAKRSNHPF